MIVALLIANCAAALYFLPQLRHRIISLLQDLIPGAPTSTAMHLSASNDFGPPADETQHRLPLETVSHPRAAPHTPTRIIVAMTGATGSVLGVHLLKTLQRMNIETHLVISKWAAATLAYETDFTVKDLKALATKTYSANDVAAPISSGSFKTLGMIIVPCSMKTLSAVATGFGEDLVTRAADVVLKERRKLVVVARETPLNAIHLTNMMTITNSGGIIFPPVPAFYTKPQSVDDIVSQSVGRMLDMFDLDAGDFERWTGMH